ncbi:MAG TPA: NDP-sugar synthase [Acidimicrobiales bacterium]|nr:NDP-sugar synthase [Acidimicrobiales bacterium]
MKAVVLVGGEGTRLRPLTFTTPKQLLPVVEVPMLERVLGQLAAHGIDEAVLSLGYQPDAFRRAYPAALASGVRLTYAVEPEPLDTAGAVGFAARHAGIDETFVVVNGDVLTDLDVGRLVSFHRASRGLATIALTPVEDPSRFGVVPTDDAGRVVAFVEKPPRHEAPTNNINAGTYVLEPAVLDRIPLGRRVSIERETFPALVADGALYAQVSHGYWLDTGTPEAYLQAHADLLGGRRPGPPAPGAHQTGDGVWTLGSGRIESSDVRASLVGDGAVVSAEAVVTGSVVGAGARVAAGATVEDAVLLSGVTVEEGAVVRGSILGPGASIGRGARLEPICVLGDGVRVEEGAKLDGVRLPAPA